MWKVGNNPVADGELGHLAADTGDNAQVAVADPPREVRGPGYLFRPLEVAPVGADFQGTDPGPGPDLAGAEVLGVERLVLDLQIPGAVENRDFHGQCPG